MQDRFAEITILSRCVFLTGSLLDEQTVPVTSLSQAEQPGMLQSFHIKLLQIVKNTLTRKTVIPACGDL